MDDFVNNELPKLAKQAGIEPDRASVLRACKVGAEFEYKPIEVVTRLKRTKK